MRAARTTDVFDLVALLVEQQARSRYADHVAVDEPYTRKLLAQAIQRNGHTNDGGTLVNVIEGADGAIDAFILGVLSRVYHVGKLLCAQDMFLVARAGVSPLAAPRLLSTYIGWASANPMVHEIHLSYTDALPEGDRMGPLYERLGFVRCGGIYRRGAGASDARNAA